MVLHRIHRQIAAWIKPVQAVLVAGLGLGLALGIASGPAQAAVAGAQEGPDNVQVRAVAARSTVAPGDRIPVAVVLDIRKGWHAWTSEEQTRVLPAGVTTFDGAQYTAIAAKASPASSAKAYVDSTQWPAFHTFQGDLGEGPQTFMVFEGQAVAFVPVEIAADAPAGPLTISFDVAYQACNDRTCDMPTSGTVTVELTVTASVASGVDSAPNEPALFADFDQSVWASVGTVKAKPIEFNLFAWEFELDPNATAFLPLLLFIAFCGGILLNFTPCVLPIIPLKIMGLSAAAAGERKRTFMLGLAMSAGVVAFWVVLGVLLGTVSQFTQVNQFFQYPSFTITVGAFIAIMAIGMAGFFSIGLPQWVYAIEPKHETYGGSILFGIMTAVLSTPCTAPLMGAAAGWAVTTDSTAIVLAVFFAIGLGMASPYILLSAFPQMARKMPKTGPASDLLKQVMGMLLLAAAAYFIGAGINGYLTEPSTFYWWVIAAIGGAAGLWMVYRTMRIAKSGTNKAIFGTVGLAIAAVSIAIGPILTYERLPWRNFSDQAMKSALADGHVVVLDFTAEWCINCKVLEKTVLESDAVAAVLVADRVTLLKADITGNTDGIAMMKQLGRNTIPLLVVLSPGGVETLKSDAYTPQQVIDAVQEAAGTTLGAAR